ncbi:hypothetical protein LTR62_001865 [Meristemomyces frigidus]|uniref:F-box domain-containing protein n=1 Tax=Meristemomyces frigidus TaxID=1508187 RepID=A0AAN7TAP0_9PEZI|nr:hypothetical protein LTR62_001865 [Meristemomyces frigidus]
MDLETLPNEIITHIFTRLPTISSVLALASTNSHFHTLYHASSQRLAILTAAANAEFGPLEDILQLCTYNASQPAHVSRQVPISDALIQEILKVGRVAQQWEDIYPFKKWKDDYASRRLLFTSERFALRRAIYRLWLYTSAFHNRRHPRSTRMNMLVVAERSALLHNWPAAELAELYDVQLVLRDVVANNICPSNGRIRQKYQKRYPDSNHQLLFNIHLNHPPPTSTWCSTSPGSPSMNLMHTQSESKYPHHHPEHQSPLFPWSPSRHHEPSTEAWGDDINHYYIIEDMMKLSPAQILLLRDRCPLKAQVESFVRTEVDQGEGWFGENGETFCETLWSVVKGRGGEVEEVKAGVGVGELGVALLGA